MTKCSPFGVNVPLSRWCGVRACWVRGSPFGLVSVRATGFSNRERGRTVGDRAGFVLHGSFSCCAAAVFRSACNP